jgi:DNA-directed RNA polymerase specialized sigma24 family protein
MTDRANWKHPALEDRIPWRIVQVEINTTGALRADTLEESARFTHQAWVHVHALERTLRMQDAALIYRLHGRGWSKRQIQKLVGCHSKTLDRRLAKGARMEQRRLEEDGE